MQTELNPNLGNLISKEANDRRPPYPLWLRRDLVLPHCQSHFVQCQIRLLLNQAQQKIRILLQRGYTPAPRFRRAAARLAKALDPDNRRAGTDLNLFGCLAPRSSSFHFRNHALTHVRRIGLRHRPPPKSESMLIDSPILRPTRRPDSIGTEHALVLP